MQTVHYFIHIPKAAGSAMRIWLRDVFERDEVFFVYTGQIPEAPDAQTYSHMELLRRAGELPASLRVLFGHYPFDPKWLLHPGCRGLSFVREPRARILSWQRYVAKHGPRLPEANLRELAERFRNGASLRNVWDETGPIPELDNGMVRLFANSWGPAGSLDEEQYQRAIDNIDKWFDYVGHIDRLESGMRRVADILGKPYQPLDDHNVSEGGRSEQQLTQLDAADEQFLDSLTHYDQRLVEWIGQRFPDD